MGRFRAIAVLLAAALAAFTVAVARRHSFADPTFGITWLRPGNSNLWLGVGAGVLIALLVFSSALRRSARPAAVPVAAVLIAATGCVAFAVLHWHRFVGPATGWTSYAPLPAPDAFSPFRPGHPLLWAGIGIGLALSTVMARLPRRRAAEEFQAERSRILDSR